MRVVTSRLNIVLTSLGLDNAPTTSFLSPLHPERRRNSIAAAAAIYDVCMLFFLLYRICLSYCCRGSASSVVQSLRYCNLLLKNHISLNDIPMDIISPFSVTADPVESFLWKYCADRFTIERSCNRGNPKPIVAPISRRFESPILRYESS